MPYAQLHSISANVVARSLFRPTRRNAIAASHGAAGIAESYSQAEHVQRPLPPYKPYFSRRFSAFPDGPLSIWAVGDEDAKSRTGDAADILQG